MDKKRIEATKDIFDSIVNQDQDGDIEFWYARELMTHLGYERWEN